MIELDDKIHGEVKRLSNLGNMQKEAGDVDLAIATWREALMLLPDPKVEWDAAMWLHASIGEAKYETQNLPAALAEFRAAENSGKGFSNAFVQIHIGMILYDEEQIQESVNPLLRAYMMEGLDIFSYYDKKYIDLLKNKNLLK